MEWKNLIKPVGRWCGRIGLKLLVLMVSFIPLKWIDGLSHLLGDLAYILVRRHRVQTIRNLRLVYGKEKSLAEIKSMVRQVFRYGMRCMAELAYYYSHNKLRRAADLISEVEGEEYLKEAVKQKKGVIGLGAHLGNFMVLGPKLSSLGYPNTAIMRQMRDEKLELMFKKVREEMGQNYISKLPTSRSVREALRWLKDGKTLMLYIDQRSGQGVEVDFLGIPTLTATGAAVFALKTGAPVLPIFSIRGDDGFYKLIIDSPVEVERTGDFERDVRSNTAKFTKVIEGYVQRYPTQWFWLHRRWKGKELILD